MQGAAMGAGPQRFIGMKGIIDFRQLRDDPAGRSQCLFSPVHQAFAFKAIPFESLAHAEHSRTLDHQANRARLRALRAVRDREDFTHMVDLTKRIYNIIPQALAKLEESKGNGWKPAGSYDTYEDPKPAGRRLRAELDGLADSIETRAGAREYDGVVDALAGLVEPVDRFFEDVLLIDLERPDDTYHRREMLVRLGEVLTRYFDLRELAGQADGRE